MALETVGIGAVQNDGTGDTLRVGFTKVNTLISAYNAGPDTISSAQWGYLAGATAFAGTLFDDADAAAARLTLELGTLALQDADDVTVTDLTVNGNITVTGTVDGRDIAADGTKLDGIEDSATADQTGAEIKALYEAEADTNAFTDADHSKLDGIEDNATADQTGAEIKALYEAEANTNALTDARAAAVDALDTISTQAADSVNIDGGAIDGVVIGANDAAAGTFSSASVDGFAASLASILSFTPTGFSRFDQRAYKDIIRKGEPARSYYTEAASSTRGSRKEMPLVGIVAWNAGNVAIVDTEFGEPTMWMVFSEGSNNLLRVLPADDVVDGELGLGVLVVAVGGGTTGGLVRVDFVQDAGFYNIAVSSSNGGWPAGIDQRNTDYGGWSANALGEAIAIANRNVNAVAISDPFDHYPLDRYGRPAFAIACATGGGASVILPDAQNRGKRVTDSLYTGGANDVTWLDDLLLYRQNGGAENIYYAALPIIEAGDGFGAIYGVSQNSPFQDGAAGVTEQIEGTFFANKSSLDFGFVDFNRSNLSGTMTALLSSTALSGWMPGDCKLALDFNVYGAGSVVASTPLDDDFTGYADQAAAEAAGYTFGSGWSFDAVNDQVDASSATDATNVRKVLSVTPGETYIVEVVVSNYSAGGLRVFVGGTEAITTISADGTHTGAVTVSSGSPNFDLRANGTTTLSIDSLTIKRDIPDLSPANNGAIINGTLTAAAVATGADLMALSGGSASNYLEVPSTTDADITATSGWSRIWVKRTGTSYGYIRTLDGSSNEAWRIGWNGVANTVAFTTTTTSGAVRTANTSAYDNDMWNCFDAVFRAGVMEIWHQGTLVGTFDASGDTLRVGASMLIDPRGPTTLVRIAKGYAPSPEQIRKMYEDERPLFEEGAKCFLPSDTVNALDAHDGLLAIGTEAGAVIHRGFERLELLDSGDVGLTESGVDSVALLGGNDIAIVTGTEGVARLASRNLAEAEVVNAYRHERAFNGTGHTDDATPLDIAKLPLSEGEILEWRGSITARSDDGAERASYTRVVRAYRDVNGNATLAGADTLGTDDETTAGMDVAFAADTTAQTIDLQVTGVASSYIQWTFDGTLVVNKQ